MDEARIREIVREEMEAARVMRAPPPMTEEEKEAEKERMARLVGESLLQFQRDGGGVFMTSDAK